MSHSEDEVQKIAWRHFFLPDLLHLSVEALLAAILLVVVNFTAFENNLLQGYPRELTFTSYVSVLLTNLLTTISQSSIATQVIIFALWAVVGMLVYILGFRFLQAVYGLTSSVNEGLGYMKTEKSQGVIHWFNTLHNFFLRTVINSLSIGLFSFAGFLTFAFAAQQVQIGLNEVSPNNILPLGLGLLGTIVGIRLIAMGICLVMPRFARWYLV